MLRSLKSKRINIWDRSQNGQIDILGSTWKRQEVLSLPREKNKYSKIVWLNYHSRVSLIKQCRTKKVFSSTISESLSSDTLGSTCMLVSIICQYKCLMKPNLKKLLTLRLSFL